MNPEPDLSQGAGRLPAGISFGREACGDLMQAQSREWLVTNGIGGYASGTIAGVLTRRYHGVLVAALRPPLDRTLLVAKLDETAEYDDRRFPLSTDRWADGTLTGLGHRNIEEFHLEGTTPVWSYGCADALLEKRIFMRQGENTTYILYTVRRASAPLALLIKTFVNYRDHHGCTTAGNWQMRIEPVTRGVRVAAFDGATPFCLLSDKAGMHPAHDWHYGFDLAAERSRGLSDREDHLLAGTFEIVLGSGESCTLVASTEVDAGVDGGFALLERQAQERSLLARTRTTPIAPKRPVWIDQTILAADQFIVARTGGQEHQGKSIIAGYHWFGDWGRDTMIALTGLTVATRRPEIARSILRTFAGTVDQGMLPNRFPDAGGQPEYNTADAALWYVEAVRAYYEATRDEGLLSELFPVLESIISWHEKGTRYGIHIDPADGLLYAGEAGVQLTWMDAKIGQWVVTPRIGKPVEINALWFNALSIMQSFAKILGRPQNHYELLRLQASAGFRNFWNEDLGCCFDVIDGPTGRDSALRPNQIIAVALPATPLLESQQRRIVEVCARHLLTPFGLRTLAPSDASYAGRYGGDQSHRDSAYHQGTVWGWLLGPFALAHYRVYRDRALAQSFLEPMRHHLAEHGVGTMSELFDGNPPFTPGGCIAQAWTVAEALRAWMVLEEGS